jgi:heme exporter protein B
VIIYAGFVFFSINPVQHASYFFLTLLLISVATAIQFLFVSTIAHASKHGSILMALLGFPVIIPLFLSALRCGAVSIGLLGKDIFQSELIIITAIMLLMGGGTVILFPHIWKDNA